MAPIVVKDANAFRELCMMFKTDTLLVYANPEVHGQEQYSHILNSMMEARKQLPISFSKSSGQEEIPQIIFALSTTKSLEPFLKLRGDGPQAVYLKLTGNETYVKCFD